MAEIMALSGFARSNGAFLFSAQFLPTSVFSVSQQLLSYNPVNSMRQAGSTQHCCDLFRLADTFVNSSRRSSKFSVHYTGSSSLAKVRRSVQFLRSFGGPLSTSRLLLGLAPAALREQVRSGMFAEYGDFRNSSFDGYVPCKLAAQLHVFHLVYDRGRLVLS